MLSGTSMAIPTATNSVDYLIIGSGIAGLTYGRLVAQRGRTIILTKKNRAESNSNYAQGGIAGVMSDDDSERLHAEDTLVAGAGLCHQDAVETLVAEGPERIRELMQLGANFSTESGPDGKPVLALGREGGHSRNRIVHFADRTGWESERALLAAIKDLPNLQILEHYFVLDLAIDEQGRCAGAYALDPSSGDIHLFTAKATLLATGGCGQVYKHTTNPAIATGDGVAMAWRAGAEIANMEFIQFHPTSLYHPEGRSFLISEAVRGDGGILRTASGETFMENYHPLGALAPRDIVARAIHAERIKRGEPCVYLDVTHLNAEHTRQRFPTIYERCLALGIDITRQPIPVVPAAHYQCGGIRTDLDGQTSIPGLFAAGEVSCTGVHGANRLASNSLLEAMVFGHRAAVKALDSPAPNGNHALSLPRPGTGAANPLRATAIASDLKGVMNDLVGIVRNTDGLERALASIQHAGAVLDSIARESRLTPETCEARNVAQVAELVVRSALKRKESRGLHYTTDYPETLESERHDTVLRKNNG
jgi:L-aspartate oxidase